MRRERAAYSIAEPKATRSTGPLVRQLVVAWLSHSSGSSLEPRRTPAPGHQQPIDALAQSAHCGNSKLLTACCAGSPFTASDEPSAGSAR